MAEKELISHRIRILGESYPVKLTEEEMIIAQQIEAELNEKINEYRIKYTVSNTKDILSMLLLTYAFELNSYKSGDSDQINSRLENLISLVEDQIDL